MRRYKKKEGSLLCTLEIMKPTTAERVEVDCQKRLEG
jgi:hypothetical protein